MRRYRESSREAYANLCCSTIGNQEWLVIKAVKQMKGCSRRMIAEHTGLSDGRVSARVRKLLDKCVLVESEDRKKCKVTGNNVYWVSVRK